MAKALLGYLSSTDPRALAQIVSENRRLRQRMTDLESHVLRLQAENDRLEAALTDDTLLVSHTMQPA